MKNEWQSVTVWRDGERLATVLARVANTQGLVPAREARGRSGLPITTIRRTAVRLELSREDFCPQRSGVTFDAAAAAAAAMRWEAFVDGSGWVNIRPVW